MKTYKKKIKQSNKINKYSQYTETNQNKNKNETIQFPLQNEYDLHKYYSKIYSKQSKEILYDSRHDEFILYHIQLKLFNQHSIIILYQLSSGNLFGSYHHSFPSYTQLRKTYQGKIDWKDNEMQLFPMIKDGIQQSQQVVWKVKNNSLCFISFYNSSTQLKSYQLGFTINSTLRLNHLLNTEYSFLSDRSNIVFHQSEHLLSSNQFILSRLIIYK